MSCCYPIARTGMALLALGLSTVVLADRSLWSELPSVAYADAAQSTLNRAEPGLQPRQLRIDRGGLDALIGKGLSSSHGTFTIDLPSPDGGYRQFEFRSSGTMSPGLAKKFPHIMAFSGRSLDKGVASAQMEVTPAGVSVQVLAPGGRWMIDPSDQSDTSKVKSYFARDAQRSNTPFQCGVTDHSDKADPRDKNMLKSKPSPRAHPAKQARSRGAELRTYRLAVATTGEYSESHGDSVEATLSAVVSVVNRVNGIFNSEISVGFELIENNDEIIFTDADTDPFEGNLDNAILIDESQEVIDDVIGAENYDIGHTFGAGEGGLAGTGPCEDGSKASGVTHGIKGDAFAVDYVAHEMGHQFSMDHTFNSNDKDCLENRSATAAFEPGAGTTIMSYNGICGSDNIVQPHLQNNYSDAMFHSYSFEQAADYVEGEGAVCGVVTDTGNTHPTVDAGGRYTVPASTPLFIEGTASDSDGDSVTYSWEQRDLGPAAALTTPDDGAIPLFRTYAPVASARRYLPQLERVVSGEFDDFEKMPQLPRTLAFALTARDDTGGRNSDTTEIQVVAEPIAGKVFSVAEPDLGGSLGKVGTVRWHVGETSNAPIAVSQVELYLSTDGGKSFPDAPFATTANDGYARVEFPSGVQTDAARIMIKGRNNIFFDVSDTDFSLNSNSAATPEVPAPTNVSGVSAGATGIDIGFKPGAGSGVNYYNAECVGEPSTTAVTGSKSPSADFDTTQSVVSSIRLDGQGSVSSEGLSIAVNITHGYRGDVILKLTAPSGATVGLKDYDGGDQAADVAETYALRGMSGETVAGNWQLEVSDGWEDQFNGTLNSWSISGTSIVPPRSLEGSKAPSASFDDNKSVTSSIPLSAEGNVSPDEFEVAVDITHTWRSDVVVELEAPSGKRITLRRKEIDDSGDDVRGTYPTTLRSLTPFSELAGEPLSGDWTLHVSDQNPVDDGVLNSWGITQEQYVFSGRGTRSPVKVEGLPTDQSYDCSIAGVYSEVEPPRQSESSAAGKVALGTQPFTSQAETAFLNLLQTVLGLDPSASSHSSPVMRNSDSAGAKGANGLEAEADTSPNAIPALGAWGISLLILLMSALVRRMHRGSVT
jgi:subtilisin-like proprotein convertase family protein